MSRCTPSAIHGSELLFSTPNPHQILTSPYEAFAALQATARSSEPKEIQDELPEGLARVKAAFDEAYAELLPSQREAVDAALAAIKSGTGLGLFLDAPGGTGKTFSANCLLNAMALSGAAGRVQDRAVACSAAKASYGEVRIW